MDAVRSKQGSPTRKIHLLEQPTWRLTKCGTQYEERGWELIGSGDPIAKDLKNYCKPCWRGRRDMMPYQIPIPLFEDATEVDDGWVDDPPFYGRDPKEAYEELQKERWECSAENLRMRSERNRIAAERDAARAYANQLWRITAVHSTGGMYSGNTLYGFDGHGEQVLSREADLAVLSAPDWIDQSQAPWKKEENKAIKAIREAGCGCVIPNWGRTGWRPFFGRIRCLSCNTSVDYEMKDGQ